MPRRLPFPEIEGYYSDYEAAISTAPMLAQVFLSAKPLLQWFATISKAAC
jgi:hypothetical protein